MGRHPLQRSVRETLAQRSFPRGGIADRPNGQFRTDATAWGILALQSAGEDQLVLEKHRARLVAEQDHDGRVSVNPRHGEPFWPTALAILAWQPSPSSRDALRRAVQFLLNTTGVQFPRTSDSPFGHDTFLRGWPWVAGTHSWIEPTALAVMALKGAGYAEHDRVREAVRMILDRQLLHGGWNYGNTLVFGRELRPMPDSTGAAVAGLAGMVNREKIARSLDYLQGEVDRLRTPVSLGWALLGLAAWDLWPSNSPALVERCLANQTRYGDYETSALCLLLLGALADNADTKATLFLHSSRIQASAVLPQE